MIKKVFTQEERTKQILTEPADQLILSLAGPAVLSMMITAIYNMADTFFPESVPALPQRQESLLSCLKNGICLIPLLLVLPKICGLWGLQLAQPAADVLSAVISVLVMRPILQGMKDQASGNCQTSDRLFK